MEKEIKIDDEVVELEIAMYRDGNIAIQAFTLKGELYDNLSVNGDIYVEADAIAIRSDRKEYIEVLREAGYIEDKHPYLMVTSNYIDLLYYATTQKARDEYFKFIEDNDIDLDKIFMER